MRVMHLVPPRPFGGAQKLAIALAAEQRQMGLGAEMIALSDNQDFDKACADVGVPVQSVGHGLKRMFKVRKLAQSADLLHLHLPPPWLWAALPKRPTAITHLHVRPVRQVHSEGVRTWIQSVSERLVLGRSDKLIAISQWIAEAWAEQHPRISAPTELVYNGIPISETPRATDGPFTIGVACRLSDRKGIEELIELAVLIHQRDPDILFRIAGDGPLLDHYRSLAEARGLANVLTFDGFVSDMTAFWRDNSIGAFTPPFEPFGLRLIEPLSHGVPVLAYLTQSGSDEIVAQCRGIEAVPYGQAQALADIAIELKNDRARLALLGQAGRDDVVSRFSLEVMTKAIESIYRTTHPGFSTETMPSIT